LYPSTNGNYFVKLNMENIRLAVQELIRHFNNFSENLFSTFIINSNSQKVHQTRKSQKIFPSLPTQIKADTNIIFDQLQKNSIINIKKKPICKSSLLQTEP